MVASKFFEKNDIVDVYHVLVVRKLGPIFYAIV
jgi:hypothetical protein